MLLSRIMKVQNLAPMEVESPQWSETQRGLATNSGTTVE